MTLLTAAVEQPTVPPPRTLGRTGTLVILAFALAIVVALLGYRSTLGEHEVFAAEPAREMLDGGNWLLQPFAEAYRTKKPPGQSWLIATSLFITQARNEYTARLPSALAATGLALLLGAIGARLGGRRVGVVAGLMTLSCHGIQVRARLAEADMALALAVALSFAGVLLPLLRGRGVPRPPVDEPRGRRVALLPPIRLGGAPWLGVRYYDGLLFWIALAAAFLIKGPIAFGFVLLPITTFVILASLPSADDRLREARHVVAAAMLNPVGIAVGLLLVVGWPIGALLTYPAAWTQWKYELFGRTMGEIRRDSVFSYLGFFPLSAMPWTLFAIYAAVVEWPRRRARIADPVAALLALWTVVSAAFLTLIAFKQLHYALPAVAPVLLMAAWGFARAADAVADRLRRDRHRVMRVAGLGWFGAVGVAWLVNQAILEPRANAPTDVALREFAARANAAVPTGEPIWLVGVGEERTVWYLRRPFRQTRFRDAETLGTQLERLPAAGPVWVLTRLPTVEQIVPLATGPTTTVATSRTYREKRGAAEQRALVRIERSTRTTTTAEAATRPAQARPAGTGE